ncbi:MAG: 3-phosphoshikimate 1-carboxyvinyltransferase [bacterium]
MIQQYNATGRIKGELNLPGDKSISHRAVIFSGMAGGKSEILNCSNGEDVKSSMACFSVLGCNIEHTPNSIIITGKGKFGFNNKDVVLDAGNSGTTCRLISGLLVAQKFTSKIIGDESLSKRPMDRIVEPLTALGADISAVNNRLPIIIKPVSKLIAIEHTLKVASAQVKSAIILAALHLDDKSTLIEHVKTRNHTEKMLGLDVIEENGKSIISVSSKNYPAANKYIVPADISSAAFFIVFTLLSKNSELIINNVLLNETRAGIITVLKAMGAKIEIINYYKNGEEISGDILVKSSILTNINIDKNIIANIIDEIPILSLAGLFADGKFEIHHAEELRYKETDRIKSLVENYSKLGLKTEEFTDGFSVEGAITNKKVLFESFGDHRIAMTFAILSMLSENGGSINNFDCVNISNPNFNNQLNSIIG